MVSFVEVEELKKAQIPLSRGQQTNFLGKCIFSNTEFLKYIMCYITEWALKDT
jgi:hypothetical protein